MKPLKEPKDYVGQLERLKDIHGLTIADDRMAIDILSRVGYYRLSAYGIGLKRKDDREKYLAGTSLDTLYRLYRFDCQLRALLLPVIEAIEVEFKTQVAYHLAMTYGAEGYRNADNFESRTRRDGSTVHAATIRKFEDEKLRQANLPCVKHHMQEYGGHFPIWAAMELFTFGMATSLFGIMQPKDRKSVALAYHMSPGHLESNLLAVGELRNRCAHYNRVYNMPFKQAPYLFKEYAEYRSNKVFPTVISLKVLQHDNALWGNFVSSLDMLIRRYPEVILPFMGFPARWLDILSTSAEMRP